MSFKCITLCALVLLIAIEDTWADGSKTLQPRPPQKMRDSKDLRFNNIELDDFNDEDGDDIIDDLYDEKGNKVDIEKLDAAGRIQHLLDELEAQERFESRAASGNRAGQRVRRRNRSGSNRCGNKRLNRRGGNRRNNRNGKRSRKGVKRVARA